MLRDEADRLDAEAKRLDREHAKLRPDAWLCEGHHRQVRSDTALSMACLGGRHDLADVELIERTVAFLEEHPIATPQRPEKTDLSSSELRVQARLRRLEQQPA